MRVALNIFRFSTSSSMKAAKLRDYKVPALNPSSTKINTLWLHGLFDNSKNFYKLAQNEKMRQLTNQTILEARNHGLSQHVETITFKEMAYDLVDYINNKDLKDLYLLGHSMGGRTIMTALDEYSSFLTDRVKGVIIVDVMPGSYAIAGAGPIEQMHRFLQEMKSINIAGKKFEEVKEEVQQKIEQKALQGTILNNIYSLPDGQLRWSINFKAFERSWNDIMIHETKNVYWRGPRKVIIGGKSKFTSVQRVNEDYPSIFADFNMERDLTVFKDSAHFLYAKEPERFISEIATFIQKVESGETETVSQLEEGNSYAGESLSLQI